jgi:hypothetical protein
MSEVMIQEVKVVTTGFAPEFGQTMGMVYNAVTPSGTNTVPRRRQVSCSAASRSARFRSSSAAPRSRRRAVRRRTAPPVPTPRSNRHRDRSAARSSRTGVLLRRLGADARDLSSNSPITITRRTRPRSACKPQPAFVPNVQTAKFFIANSDLQVNPGERATGSLDPLRQRRAGTTARQLVSLEQATDFLDADGLGCRPGRDDDGLEQAERVPLCSMRNGTSSRCGTAISGSGPAVTITGIASFGSPRGATGHGNEGFDFKQNITQ